MFSPRDPTAAWGHERCSPHHSDSCVQQNTFFLLFPGFAYLSFAFPTLLAFCSLALPVPPLPIPCLVFSSFSLPFSALPCLAFPSPSSPLPCLLSPPLPCLPPPPLLWAALPGLSVPCLAFSLLLSLTLPFLPSLVFSTLPYLSFSTPALPPHPSLAFPFLAHPSLSSFPLSCLALPVPPLHSSPSSAATPEQPPACTYEPGVPRRLERCAAASGGLAGLAGQHPCPGSSPGCLRSF